MISTRKFITCLALPLVWVTAALVGQTDSSKEITDPDRTWAALAADSENFLEWSEDPLKDLDLGPTSMTIWSVSAWAGGGHSDNFLKRVIPEDSSYLQLEGDAFINTLFDEASLTALLFFEFTRYKQDADADSESIAFLHVNWSIFRNEWTWGLEFETFYGDQIYDASLSSVSTPIGANLRQIRPEIAFFAEKLLGPRDSLRAGLSLRRALYKEIEEDYWRPGLSVEWVRQWTASIETSTEAALYAEFYDEDPARQADGLELVPEDELEIHGFQVQETAVWKPVQLPSFKATLRVGISAEAEKEGEYESLLRLFSSLSLSWKSDWVDVRADGRWQNTRYRDRHSGFADTRPLHQSFRSLRLEAERELKWNTSLKFGVEWSDFNSRSSDEIFSERRVEALLKWSY